jgi:SAM-dependent methyltransferase
VTGTGEDLRWRTARLDVHDGSPRVRHAADLGTVRVVQPAYGMRTLVEDVFPGGLAGRSVLDCACNAGGYLFEAVRHGAGRALGFDVRAHWIAQAQFLARHLPSEHVEFQTLDLASLPALRLQPFDVTLFQGSSTTCRTRSPGSASRPITRPSCSS